MKKLKQLIGTIAVLSSVAPSAFAAMPNGYFGVDVTQTNQSFKSGRGKDIFRKNPQEYGAFVGLKLSRHFGVEAGWEQQASKKRSGANPVSALDQNHITQTGTFNYDSSVKGRHPYLGVFGECKHKSWRFQALLGASFSQMKIKVHSLSTTGVVPIILATGRTVTGQKSRVVPMVKLSVMKNVTRCFGVKISGMYRNTSAMKIKLAQDPTVSNSVRLKDTFGIGLGLVYSFR